MDKRDNSRNISGEEILESETLSSPDAWAQPEMLRRCAGKKVENPDNSSPISGDNNFF